MFSGRWLQHICSIRLECFLDRLAMFLMNFLNGNASPNWASLFLWGEWFHSSDHSFLIDRLKACLRAEALLGRGVLRRGGGWLMRWSSPVRGQVPQILSTSPVSLVLFRIVFYSTQSVLTAYHFLLTHMPSPFLCSCSDPTGCHGLYLGPSIIF